MKTNAATILLLVSFPALTAGWVSAQSTGAAKEAQPVAYPYAAEESGGLSPSLARKDLDLRAALSAAPDSAELMYAYALILRQEGNARESLAAYTRAASIRKPTAQELRSVALDYVMLSDYDDAIHWLELAVQIDPHDADVLYSLGRCYYSKDRYQEAQKLYEQVLAIQPKNIKAEENIGLVYDATNEPEKAEEALRKATSWADANGTDEWPFLDLGAFLLDHNRLTEAIDDLRIAVRIKPARAESHEKLGRALLASQDTVGGINELREATRLEPENPRTHYELGRALRQAGQVDKAQEEFKLSQKLYTSHSQE
jgi:tetratricopeptide (TPR) repeat protein